MRFCSFENVSQYALYVVKEEEEGKRSHLRWERALNKYFPSYFAYHIFSSYMTPLHHLILWDPFFLSPFRYKKFPPHKQSFFCYYMSQNWVSSLSFPFRGWSCYFFEKTEVTSPCDGGRNLPKLKITKRDNVL